MSRPTKYATKYAIAAKFLNGRDPNAWVIWLNYESVADAKKHWLLFLQREQRNVSEAVIAKVPIEQARHHHCRWVQGDLLPKY